MPSDEMLHLFEARLCPTCFQSLVAPPEDCNDLLLRGGYSAPVAPQFEAYEHRVCLCTNCGEMLFDEPTGLRKPSPEEEIYARFAHEHAWQAQVFIRMRCRMDV